MLASNSFDHSYQALWSRNRATSGRVLYFHVIQAVGAYSHIHDTGHKSMSLCVLQRELSLGSQTNVLLNGPSGSKAEQSKQLAQEQERRTFEQSKASQGAALVTNLKDI